MVTTKTSAELTQERAEVLADALQDADLVTSDLRRFEGGSMFIVYASRLGAEDLQLPQAIVSVEHDGSIGVLRVGTWGRALGQTFDDDGGAFKAHVEEIIKTRGLGAWLRDRAWPILSQS
jgi:hypothetical protein